MSDLLKEKEMRGWGFSTGIWTNLPIQHCALALRLSFWVMEELGVFLPSLLMMLTLTLLYFILRVMRSH